jgi:hypothetical protein
MNMQLMVLVLYSTGSLCFLAGSVLSIINLLSN